MPCTDISTESLVPRYAARRWTARATVDPWEHSAERTAPLTEEAVRLAFAEAGGIVGLLRECDRTERAELYKAFGLSLTYEKEAATGEERVLAGCSYGVAGVGFEPTTFGL